MTPQALSLGQFVTARLCHDLGGIAGTLGGTLDLLEGGDPAMLELLRETAQVLRLRLRLYAAAWGGAAAEMDAAALEELLQGAPAVPRVGFGLEGLSPGGALPAPLVPLALNAALLGAEALPRGGRVRLTGDAAQGLAVVAEGRGAAWPPALLRTLAGAEPVALVEELGPRHLVAPMLALSAAALGWRVSLAFGPPGLAAPLLLAPGAPAG